MTETAKPCAKCKEVKPGTDFARHSGRKDGLQTYCRACSAIRSREWEQSNRGARRVIALRSYTNNRADRLVEMREAHQRNKAERNAASRAWYAANAETARAQARERYAANVEANRERARQFLKAHPEVSAAKQRRRVAQKNATADGTFSRDALIERDRWVCGICGERIDETLKATLPMSASVDHIVPLSRGGAHTLANTRLAHRLCNESRQRT